MHNVALSISHVTKNYPLSIDFFFSSIMSLHIKHIAKYMITFPLQNSHATMDGGGGHLNIFKQPWPFVSESHIY